MAAIPIRELYRRYETAKETVSRLNETNRQQRETIESLKVTEAGLRDRIRHLNLQIQNLHTRNPS